MDTTKNKTPLSLEQVLISYNVMIIFIIIFVILMIILVLTNKKGFNKSFGYEIFITGPILLIVAYLIKEIFNFKNNPQQSWLSKLPKSNEIWFLPVVSLFVLLIGLLGFFMMLYVGGIFSNNPPENNTAMIMNFFIIIVFLVLATVIYNKYQNKDEQTIKSLPKAIQDTFYYRTRYTVMFVIFIILLIIKV